jgi:E3 SUMO-protein ligase PIAS1
LFPAPQAACLLPSDPVPFRIHWPAHSELHVNSHWVRSSPRVGDYKMGINARDDPADLLPYVHAGRSNTVQLTCRDMYTGYVLLVCIVRRRTMQQVKVRQEGRYVAG